ncbi:Cullin-domain-containing protein [Cristinia sonorae]|uniref:Cullin-domain-containing protein n=1 Tax=Cristinia sonorae TaxID=1940300 RepID=A0A8K0US35_9AGAR|nr:Cullin-domain-containing protein [Cristinia sonorae]
MSTAEDVYALLTFPASHAFKDYHPSGFTMNISGSDSGSPPRKTPRLDADSDSASASRSRLLTSDEAIASGSSKKAVIKIRLAGPPIQEYTDRHYDADFALLKRSLRVLFTPNEALPGTYDRVFNACRVCVAHRGEGLYENLKMEVERCVGDVVQRLAAHESQGALWLNPFVEACEWFERQVGLLESLFAYLDRVYINVLPGNPSIRSICYSQFAARVFNAVVTLRIQEGIAEWIEYERTTVTADEHRPVIVRLITQLKHHKQYANVFERHLLSLTKSFYVAESAEKVEELSAEKFLVHCQKRREEEIARAKEVLPEESWERVREATDRALLEGRLDWLVDNALKPLMDASSKSGLGRMYRLFGAVDGMQTFVDGWSKYVEAKVKAIVTDKDHDEDMVQSLLTFKDFANSLVATTFANTHHPPPALVKLEDDTKMIIDPDPTFSPRQEFQYALSDSFRRGFKQRRNKPAEMLAKHVDRAMRKGQQGRKDEEFEDELDRVLELYRFTDDKDVFRTFYHKALAKRLLLEKSASDDFEKAMLKKLKEQYDPEFSMGDHMFNDLALSRDSMREYYTLRERQGDVAAAAQRLNVMVLQRSFWPFTVRKSEADLPLDMQAELTKFTDFYKQKHQGHKLDWDHGLGTATLRARFSRGEKELSVSLYQTLVLLLFNEDVQIGFRVIKERTRIEDGELRRTLQSLALGKKRVLKKQPMGKDVLDTDVFSFNSEFQDAAHRIHINSIQVKETAEESKKTQTLIESDRKHVLDAAIVRVMKAKKELHNEQLKTATIEAVKNHFVPNVNMIKERIDELVEQEYLKRHETDMNVFVYVA